jgi:hypothetical protein
MSSWNSSESSGKVHRLADRLFHKVESDDSQTASRRESHIFFIDKMAVVGGLAPFFYELPNPIPVRNDTVQKLSGARAIFDYDDIQIAYYNLGLHSKSANRLAQKPTRNQIRGYIRRLG